MIILTGPFDTRTGRWHIRRHGDYDIHPALPDLGINLDHDQSWVARFPTANGGWTQSYPGGYNSDTNGQDQKVNLPP
ncbi:MAG: hypothetical protein P1R58_08570 [bacterium]|nr:hypothetical protein [bacterium]